MLLRHDLLHKKFAVGQSALGRIALHYRIARRDAFAKIAYWLWRFIFWHKKNNHRQSGQNYNKNSGINPDISANFHKT